MAGMRDISSEEVLNFEVLFHGDVLDDEEVPDLDPQVLEYEPPYEEESPYEEVDEP